MAGVGTPLTLHRKDIEKIWKKLGEHDDRLKVLESKKGKRTQKRGEEDEH